MHQSIIRQPVGGSAEDPIEVSVPETYDGPIDYAVYREILEAYYLSLVGPEGRAIRMGPGVRTVRMQNVNFEIPAAGQFQAAEE